MEETGSIIVQPNSLTHSAPQHDLCQPNLNVGPNFADSYSCPPHSCANKASGDMRGQLSTDGPSDTGPIEPQASSTHAPEPHSGLGAARGRSLMGSGKSSTSEYELCLDTRTDQWSELFWSTVQELQESLSPDFPEGVPAPLKRISVPVGSFRVQNQDELAAV